MGDELIAAIAAGVVAFTIRGARTRLADDS
jgi:hypothetical protein